jgi:negative regulator of flagellin synthesis FlgM
MIDPVRPGPVKSVATPSDARRLATQELRNSGARSAASLPRLLDLVADLTTAGPPVDYARIAEVRRAIADGSYQIDADAIAKAITGFAAKV